MSVVDCGVGVFRTCSPSAPVSGTGTGFGPMPSRERGIRMVVVLACSPAHPPPLWIADQVRNDVTMLCIVFTLTFDPLPSRERGYWWLVWLVVCLFPAPHLWIADQVRNDVTMRCMKCATPCGYCLKASMTATLSCRPVVSRLRGNDGEGSGNDGPGWLGLADWSFLLF